MIFRNVDLCPTTFVAMIILPLHMMPAFGLMIWEDLYASNCLAPTAGSSSRAASTGLPLSISLRPAM
jgi:hypothetical protein